MLQITDEIQLQDWEIVESFSRAGGPGGQHVNKVSTAVTLRFEAMRSPHLSAGVKRRLRHVAGRRWGIDGAITIQVSDTRSQARNREIARARLTALIQAALVKPKPRIPTRISAGIKERRLKAKKSRSEIKTLRRKTGAEDTS